MEMIDDLKKYCERSTHKQSIVDLNQYNEAERADYFKDHPEIHRGIFKYENGIIYIGEWKNGKRDGIGICIKDGKTISSGIWKEDKLWTGAEFEKEDAEASDWAKVAKSVKERVSGVLASIQDFAKGRLDSFEKLVSSREFYLKVESIGEKVVAPIGAVRRNVSARVLRKLVGGIAIASAGGYLAQDFVRNKEESLLAKGAEFGEKKFWEANDALGEMVYEKKLIFKTITFADGIYKGETLNEKRHGKGEMEYKNGRYNGRTYVGNWKDDKMDGNGIMYEQYSWYEGEWKSDVKHGKGVIYYYFSGRTEVERWEEGIRIR